MMVSTMALVVCLCITPCMANMLGENSGNVDQFRRIDNEFFKIEEKIDNEAKARRDGLEVVLDKLYNIEDLIAGHMVSRDDHEDKPVAEQVRVEISSSGKTYGKMIHSLLQAFQVEKQLNRRVQRHVSDLEADIGSLKGAIMDFKLNIEEQHEKLNVLAEDTGDIKDTMNASLKQSSGMLDMLTNLDRKVNEILQVLDNQRVKFESCEELLNNGYTASGLYAIYPANRTFPLQVYCDQVTDGGGWIVFQRREDGSENFYRNWIDYKFGFGNLEGEFWLGNEYLYILTHSVCDSLRVDLEDVENNHRFAKYSRFSIGSKAAKYTLSVSGYTGDAGDSLSSHNENAFSTKDRDNDNNGGSCSVSYKGAWWYNNCHASNLNGYYYGGKHDSYADGVNWYTWKKHKYSLKMTEMKCR